jgi:uncharacterized membrane protein YsdA (DUF1294 family)
MNPNFQQHPQRRGAVSAFAVALFVALLVLPALASVRLAQLSDSRLVLGYLATISVVAFLLYGHDKRSAEASARRTPESTLHLAELFGGWPAAFIAQRTFRHKISKTSYQFAFWSIVSLHEIVSFDFLHDWHYLRSALVLLHT